MPFVVYYIVTSRLAEGSARVAFTVCSEFSPEYHHIPASVFPVLKRLTSSVEPSYFAAMIADPVFESTLTR